MVPRMNAKLLMAYNIRPGEEERYYRFVVGEFLPRLQKMGLLMVEGWHTAYGNYPARLMGFVAENDAAIGKVLDDDMWREQEEKLLEFVTDYEIRVVPFRNSFQFFHPSSKKE